MQSRAESIQKLSIGNLWRERFPIFSSSPELIYFDSSSTTQKPKEVIEAERNFWETKCANPGRGAYDLAEQAKEIVDSVREEVITFLGRSDPDEIVFTAGATMSLNYVACAWGAHMLQHGDQVHFCPNDHLALNSPWLALKERLAGEGKIIELVPYRLYGDGSIDIASLLKDISPQSRVINLAHVSNTVGIVNDLQLLRPELPHRVVLNGDLCQSVGHTEINLTELDLDFASFSAHKCFASTGTGVLWINPKRHNELKPVFFGGGMDNSSNVPAAFLESGSMHVAGIVSLSAAVKFMKASRVEGAEDYLISLTDYLFSSILKMKHIELVYPPKHSIARKRVGIATFKSHKVSCADIGEFLAFHGLAVRYGSHCAGLAEGGNSDTVRISLQLYNTFEEVEKCCLALEKLG